MKLTYACPRCDLLQRQELSAGAAEITCGNGDWSRMVTVPEPASSEDGTDGVADSLDRCLVCDCPDLWRQKDFPARLGLLMVAVGAIASTVAYLMYRPILSLGILMVFAAIDLVLYAIMPDVLVCYLCKARHRPDSVGESHEYFNHDTAERYRQQELRLNG